MNDNFLNVNAGELNTLGKNISSLADETKQLTGKVKNEIETLDSAWSGDAARQYVTLALDEVAAINKLVDDYATAGSEISRTANDYDETSSEISSAIKF